MIDTEQGIEDTEQNRPRRTGQKSQEQRIEDKEQSTENEKWKTGDSATVTLMENRRERIEDKEERREIDNRG